MDVFVWLTVFVLIWAIIAGIIAFVVRTVRNCGKAPTTTK